MADHKKVWENGQWRTEPLTEEDRELLARRINERPIQYEDGTWSNDINNIVPSDFGKLRRLYGEELAEQIEIDDDIAHARAR